MSKNGKNCIFAESHFKTHTMLVVGTYPSKIDDKGRLTIPLALKKQIGAIEEGWVIKPSIFEKCLELYTQKQWKRTLKKLEELNPFEKSQSQYLRNFLLSVKWIEPDSANRLLLPKEQMGHAKIAKEVIMLSQINCIEIWDKGTLDNLPSLMNTEEMSEWTEKFFSKNKNG